MEWGAKNTSIGPLVLVTQLHNTTESCFMENNPRYLSKWGGISQETNKSENDSS